MSISYNRRKKAIKKQVANRMSTINLFGDVWRYRFNGRKWTLEKAKVMK